MKTDFDISDYLAWSIRDRQIDALVYDLYALTPAEIQIVEGAAT